MKKFFESGRILEKTTKYAAESAFLQGRMYTADHGKMSNQAFFNVIRLTYSDVCDKIKLKWKRFH